ncbi:MAG: SpoIIE family protein phosphatase [candidate division WOR-3 bacterium]
MKEDKNFPSIEFNIECPEDVLRAGSETVKFVKGFSLKEKDIEELKIVIKEISKNMIKHSSSGKLSIFLEGGDEKSVYIVAENPVDFPVDTKEIFDDGYSTAKTLGIGLGAVKRLLNDVKVKVENGKFILSGRKIFSDKKRNSIEISVYSRPMSGFKSNGDAYFVKRYGDYAVVAVLDGIGHGTKANLASKLAIKVLKDRFKDDLEEIVLAIHHKLQHSRGCVIGIVRMSKNGDVEFLGIGNIKAQIYTPEMYRRLVSFDGLLGSNMRSFKTEKMKLTTPCLIVLHSDGVSSFNFEDKRVIYRPVMEVAKEAFEKYRKKTDDATLLIAKIP